MSLRSRVIGVGSRNGDDQVGLQLVERLKGRGDLPADFIELDDPSNLLDHVDGCDRLIVIDSCVSGAAPGTVTRATWPDNCIDRRSTQSTHGLGIPTMLGIAESLGRLPPEVIVFGIEVGQCDAVSEMSEELKSCMDELEQKLADEIC